MMDFKRFHASEFERADFRKFLVAKMLVYGLHGHCFLVFEWVAYYPHDDMGFGVVALQDDADFSAAHEFLGEAGTLPDYHSIIEK